MKKRECLKCGKSIINRDAALFCNVKCQNYVNNRKLWLKKNRVSDCCNSGLDVYPDENGKLQFKCMRCRKFTNTAKIFFPAYLDGEK